MESGDGLLVRVRPRAATLTLAAVKALATAAARVGNGHIDLTRRANLQMRGVGAGPLAGLLALLGELGLLDPSPDAEAIRNIVSSPLAGADAGELLDVRPLALALERALGADRSLWRLPGKVSFVVDGGGALGLDAVRADIRLKAVGAGDGTVRLALGLDRPQGPLWLGQTAPETAVAAVVRLAQACLEVSEPGMGSRLRDLPASTVGRIRASLARLIEPLADAPLAEAERRPLGTLRHRGNAFAVGLAAPFGRLDAGSLGGLAAALASLGIRDIRLSPWRVLYIPVGREADAEAVLEAARKLAFIVDPADPLLRIEACPGAPACRAATLDTRSAARRLAPLLAQIGGVTSVHVSGCAKGCARSAAADLVLVATGDRFGVVRNGRADGGIEAVLAPGELDRLPALIGVRERGTGYA
jgi:precorrin-3B synthase